MSPNLDQFLKISTPVLKDWSPNFTKSLKKINTPVLKDWSPDLTKISEKISIPVLKDWSPNFKKSLKNQHSSTQRLVT